MKNRLRSLIFLLLCLTATVKAQLVNGNFENWSTTLYSDPQGWGTANQDAISKFGIVPVTRVNGVTGSAIRLETFFVGPQFVEAYFTNGDPFNGTGGIPCGQQPTAIAGSYRYNVQTGDTALILAVFVKNGAIFSSNIFPITGMQNNFTAFSFPLSLGQIPDTVILAATSSNLLSGNGIQAGSFLELDNLAFTGTTVTIPNGGFDNWVSASYNVATGWEAYGSVSRTGDSQSGVFAIQLTTVDEGGGNYSQAGITNGQNTNNGSIGGVPYTQQIDTLTGYYKYIVPGSDSANFGVSLSANGVNVGGSFMFLTATPVYTYFEMPLFAGMTPDTLRINANSSNWPMTALSVGSTLYIDNLMLKSQGTTGISIFNRKNNSETFVYPNPVGDVAAINLPQAIQGQVRLVVYDVSGRLMQEEYYQNSGLQLPLNTATLNPGMYFFEVSSENLKIQNKFVKR